MVERLKEEVPKHDGGLKTSIRAKVNATSLEIYMLDYGLHVEFGTMPHPMNPEWLRKWCKDVLGDEDARFAVANHIRKYGTQPHPFMRPILNTELLKLIKKSIILLGKDAIIKM